ncbi:MAG: FAD-dependent oxidoreductase [Deltaproteobacteria bacterium]|nr:MAG: FAD-dependent oxidoreductase [Deltaproteobacteria bacterium]
MSDFDVIVVGGGISGLSYAWGAAARGREALVLDAAPRLGGCLHSPRTGDGYWFELGAHTAYNSYGGLLAILEGLGMMERLVPRQKVPFRLLVDGQLRSITKELSFLRLFGSLPRAPFTKKDGRTAREYFSRLVGKRNYERVLSPMLAAVPSQPADDFPATMLFKKRPRRKDVLRSFTLDGGLGSVADAIAAAPRVSVRRDCPVASVAPDGERFAVTLQSGERLVAEQVAVALPPDVAARVLAGAWPELAEPLAEIGVVSVDSLGVVVPADKVTLPAVAGIVPKERDAFFSVVTRDVVPDTGHRAFTFHFAPGLASGDRLGRALAVLGVSESDVVATHERTSRLPSPRPGHPALVAALDAALDGSRLALTGSYFAGLAIEDCIGRSNAELDRLKV